GRGGGEDGEDEGGRPDEELRGEDPASAQGSRDEELDRPVLDLAGDRPHREEGGGGGPEAVRRLEELLGDEVGEEARLLDRREELLHRLEGGDLRPDGHVVPE